MPSARSDLDWEKIKKEYISGHTFEALAAKYGVSAMTIKRYAKKGDWTRERKIVDDTLKAIVPEVDCSVVTKAVTTKKVTTAIEFWELIEQMTERVRQAIAICDPENAKAIALLTGALKDLQKMQFLDRTESDRAEQSARIEALRAKTEESRAALNAAKDRGGTIMLVLDKEPSDGQ